MSGLVSLSIMAVLLGAGSFAVGMLPLSIQFSRRYTCNSSQLYIYMDSLLQSR
jgi:hypothetical protein